MKKFLIILYIAAMCFTLMACAAGAGGSEGEEAMGSGAAMVPFRATDLEGKTITDAVFAEKDVTILNVWATYCEPCKAEMPQLAEMDADLPDNAQIIGMVADAREGDETMIETAQDICADTGVSYTNIVMNGETMDLLTGVTAVPTTFILDSAGQTVCSPIIGADVEGYQRAVTEYLEQIN